MASGADVPAPAWESMVVVGRVVKAHGLRGSVVVSPETDFLESRFRAGAAVWMNSTAGPVARTVESVRLQGRRAIVAFEGIGRLEDAAELVGRELRVPEDALQPLEPGTYYTYQLRGCRVELSDATVIGVVSGVDGGPGTARLVVEGVNGEILVPLAVDICTTIDVGAGRIVIEPPEGLLELNEVRYRDDLPPDGRGGTRRGRRRPGH